MCSGGVSELSFLPSCHGLCVSELSFLPSCTYIHCMWGLLGVFACVPFVSFLVVYMYLHFFVVLCAMHVIVHVLLV